MYVVLRYRFTHTHTQSLFLSFFFLLSLSCVLVCQPLLSHSLSTKKKALSLLLWCLPLFSFTHSLVPLSPSLLLSFSRSYIWFSLLLLVRWTIHTACERLPFYLRIYCSCCHAITKSHLHFLTRTTRQRAT